MHITYPRGKELPKMQKKSFRAQEYPHTCLAAGMASSLGGRFPHQSMAARNLAFR